MHHFWTLNRTPVTTFAPVRAGKAQKCDPSEPARAGRIPRGLREDRFSAPAPSPLEFFTRLFLEHTILLEPFFLRTPARRTWGRRIREACGHFRRPQKPLSEHTEYPKSRSMGLFWNLNRAPVTTFAPVRAGKAQKCDPSEPARAGRIPRGPREYSFSPPAPSPLEYFTRLFLKYTVLLKPFFLAPPARRTLGSAELYRS